MSEIAGKVVAINIARASRVASYAIPAKTVAVLLDRLQADLVAQDD